MELVQNSDGGGQIWIKKHHRAGKIRDQGGPNAEKTQNRLSRARARAALVLRRRLLPAA